MGHKYREKRKRGKAEVRRKAAIEARDRANIRRIADDICKAEDERILAEIELLLDGSTPFGG